MRRVTCGGGRGEPSPSGETSPWPDLALARTIASEPQRFKHGRTTMIGIAAPGRSRLIGLFCAGTAVLAAVGGCSAHVPRHSASSPGQHQSGSPARPGASRSPRVKLTDANTRGPAVRHAEPLPREPHFSTPAGAMRYLARAYNQHDTAALHEVTTPESYRVLKSLRSQAVDLRLKSCSKNTGRGDYTCQFAHAYPASMHQSGRGSATFLVAPALDPGWYLYVVADCG